MVYSPYLQALRKDQMMNPLEISYSLPLLVISVATAVLSSYVALELASTVINSRKKGVLNVWLWTSATALGLGIWTMHFIGMFALQLPMPMRYSAGYTIISLLIAIAASFSGFSFVYLLRQPYWVFAGGLIMGLGIAGMHYLGMFAMRMDIDMSYDATIVILSIFIAIAVSTIGLWILMRMKQGIFAESSSTKILTAIVMGTAISSMHYTGMAALSIVPSDTPLASTGGFLIEGDAMIATLSVAAILLILFPLYSVSYENRFSKRITAELALLRINEARLRMLIENAPDAFFVYNEEGRFLDVNNIACSQLGYTREELLHTNISEIEDSANDSENLWPSLDAGEGCTVNSVHVRRDGSKFPVEMNIIGIVVGGKKQMFALVRDVTETEKLKAHLSQLAMTDELTQLYNRRAFLMAFDKEIASARRSKKPLSVITVDIDYFKKVNDTYGHYVGDLALQHFAKIANRSIRTEDTIGRLGGEEFAIILPNANEMAAQCMGERLRKMTESESFVYGDVSIHYTVSIGIAELTEQVTQPSKLLDNADKALYEAKGAGRNRVVLYTP